MTAKETDISQRTSASPLPEPNPSARRLVPLVPLVLTLEKSNIFNFFPKILTQRGTSRRRWSGRGPGLVPGWRGPHRPVENRRRRTTSSPLNHQRDHVTRVCNSPADDLFIPVKGDQYFHDDSRCSSQLSKCRSCVCVCVFSSEIKRRVDVKHLQ